MAYIDMAYYRDVFMGEPIDDPDVFAKYTVRATDIINQITNYRIQNIEKYHQTVYDAIKKAICSQVEYLLLNGESVIHGDSAASVSVGNFSYSGETGNKTVSPATINYLSSVGLLYKGLITL